MGEIKGKPPVDRTRKSTLPMTVARRARGCLAILALFFGAGSGWAFHDDGPIDDGILLLHDGETVQKITLTIGGERGDGGGHGEIL